MIITSQQDIETYREAGYRLAETLAKLAQRAVPGMPLAELDFIAETDIRERGDTPAFLHYTPEGADRPFPATLCASVNEEVVHGIPTEGERKLEEGDIIGLDLGLVHDGFIVDAAITVPVGAVDAERKRLVIATRDALNAGIAAVHPGAHIGDIGAAIAAFTKQTSFSLVTVLGGHGVGTTLHEEPFVPNDARAGTGARLKQGMVLAIEPMLCIGTGDIQLEHDGYTYTTRDGKPSAHFEHTILITKDGVEILTQL